VTDQETEQRRARMIARMNEASVSLAIATSTFFIGVWVLRMTGVIQ
jgi:hypothetical protein